MRVYEIFRSLQGETTLVGMPMWFIRVAGCDLACSYCDTPEARNPEGGREMGLDEILETVALPPLPYAMITGGEPMLQLDEVNALAASLLSQNVEVLVETSGAHVIADLDPRARRIVDFKTPGSGMADRIQWENAEELRPEDEAKFILTGRDDYEWAKKAVVKHDLLDRAAVLFGAADGRLHATELAEWLVEDALPIRLNARLHRYLGLR
jgi:7-carboxy-7-deazaguanine synthase